MILLEENKESKSITSYEDIFEIMQSILKKESKIDQDKEHIWAIGLNEKNRIQYIELVSLGVIDECLIRPVETLRLAVIKGVKSLIIVHNHPSGDIKPSPQDKNITKQMKEACNLLGITLLDHLIITLDNYYSFSKECSL